MRARFPAFAKNALLFVLAAAFLCVPWLGELGDLAFMKKLHPELYGLLRGDRTACMNVLRELRKYRDVRHDRAFDHDSWQDPALSAVTVRLMDNSMVTPEMVREMAAEIADGRVVLCPPPPNDYQPGAMVPIRDYHPSIIYDRSVVTPQMVREKAADIADGVVGIRELAPRLSEQILLAAAFEGWACREGPPQTLEEQKQIVEEQPLIALIEREIYSFRKDFEDGARIWVETRCDPFRSVGPYSPSYILEVRGVTRRVVKAVREAVGALEEEQYRLQRRIQEKGKRRSSGG